MKCFIHHNLPNYFQCKGKRVGLLHISQVHVSREDVPKRSPKDLSLDKKNVEFEMQCLKCYLYLFPNSRSKNLVLFFVNSSKIYCLYISKLLQQ